MKPPQVSIVVPTLNEAANLPHLLPRVHAALAGRRYEVLVVDDNSADDTAEVCAELSERYPLRLLTRRTPENGLSGAVLHGMAAARGELLVVMDADLQHPPERLPNLLAPLEADEAEGGEESGTEFVIGSRYAPGGTTDGRWGLFRKLNSRLATLLARPFVGRTHDPMAGFFALRRRTYRRAEALSPVGYKIGLELLCKCRVRRVTEVPIHFSRRVRGESKLSLKEQWRYLAHLGRLYRFAFPRLTSLGNFAAASLLGTAVAALMIRLTPPGTVGPAAALGTAYVTGLAAVGVAQLAKGTARTAEPRPLRLADDFPASEPLPLARPTFYRKAG